MSKKELRRKMVLTDTVEAVIGLGKNLFYNSAMESCLLVCNTQKAKSRKNKVLFVNAYNEIRNEKTIAYLDEVHIQKILKCYNQFDEIEDFSKIVTLKEILETDSSLHITRYVKSSRLTNITVNDVKSLISLWTIESDKVKEEIKTTISNLNC